MTKRGKTRAKRTRRRATSRRRARTRQLLLIVLGGFSVFLFLALVTWAPEGARSGNICGTLGHQLAEPVLAWFGFASFVLFGVMAYWGVAALLGLPLLPLFLRGAGIVLVTLSSGAFFSLVLDHRAYLAGGLFGPGGLAGTGIATRLEALSGEVGTFLVSITGTLLGLALATDWLFLELARHAGKALHRVGRLLADTLPHLARAAAGRAERLRPPVPAATTKAVAVPVEAPPAPELGEEEREIQPAPERPPPRDRTPPGPPARAARPKKKKVVDGDYQFPSTDLLDEVKNRDPRLQDAMIRENAEILEETLREFRVEAEVAAYTRGPVVTLYELRLAAGVKVNRIHNLSEDLAVALKAPAVRVVAPLPGRSTIGVEVPNPVRDDVRLRPLAEDQNALESSAALPLYLGTDVAGTPLVEDLTAMPHMLIAGATGSGKSVCVNSILLSLLLTRTPEEVRMILIDPKQVELAFFSKVPHLMSPVVTEMKRAVSVLEWLVDQMEQRYAIFHTMEVRNIRAYNELGPERIAKRKKALGIGVDEEEDVYPDRLPYIVIVVDELADLMMVAGKEIENLITRLAQKSRAVGIHIILATQRPSTDVITGLIKANMPSRISFQVASKIDSRVILDQNGADKLLGRGDMLYLPPGTSHLVRAQGTFVSDGEVKRVVKFLAERGEQEFDDSLSKAQSGQLIDDDERDPLYEDAVRIILDQQRGSASLLQRALGVGYTRGSRLMDQMHKEGIVGAYKGSKARDVLMTLAEYEELSQARSSSP